MPTHWVPTTIILGYTALVTLLALAGAFSHTAGRRDAAYRILRVLLPWSVLATIVEARLARTGT
ncbi:hypothetical protein [Longispora urticae]